MSVWWVVWSLWAYINEPRDPKDLLYKVVELASLFSDLQNLTYFGCASKLSISKLNIISPTHKRTEGRAPVWGSEFNSRDAALQGGMMVVLRPLFAAALVVCRRYFIVAPSPFPAAQLVVHRR